MSRPSTANNRRGSGTPTAAASAGNNAAAPTASSSTSTPAPTLADLTPLLGTNLKLTLNSGDLATGLLFAFDPNLGTVALETLTTTVPAYLSTSIAGGAGNNAKQQAAAAAAAAAQESIRRTGFRLIKIREVKRVELAPPVSDAALNGTSSTTTSSSGSQQQQELLTPLQALNVAASEARANSAIRDAHIRASRRGVGVSDQAQHIFDALSKTLPCRWHGTHIIVMDEIVISGPNYDGSSTNVAPYSHDQLHAALDGNPIPPSADGKALAPQAVNSIRPKAASWQRVVKVLEGERAKIQRQQPATAS